MAISNGDRVGRGLETLRDGLAPFVEWELKARLSRRLAGSGRARQSLRDPPRRVE